MKDIDLKKWTITFKRTDEPVYSNPTTPTQEESPGTKGNNKFDDSQSLNMPKKIQKNNKYQKLEKIDEF